MVAFSAALHLSGFWNHFYFSCWNLVKTCYHLVVHKRSEWSEEPGRKSCCMFPFTPLQVHARQAALTPGGVDLFALSSLFFFFDSDSTKLSCLIHSGKWSGGAAAAELRGLQRRGGGRAHCCRSASAPSVTQTLSSAQVLTLTCCHLGTIRTAPCVNRTWNSARCLS